MGSRDGWGWDRRIQETYLGRLYCFIRPIVFSLIFYAAQLCQFFSKRRSSFSCMVHHRICSQRAVMISLLYFVTRRQGFLDVVLWYSFCLYQCHHRRWFCLLKPPAHSQRYIGISLWENLFDQQTDAIIEIQVKSAPTMAALRVSDNMGLCSHPSTA